MNLASLRILSCANLTFHSCLPINNCQPDFGYCVGASDSSSSLLGTPTTILSANGTSTSTPTSLHTTTTLQSANSSTTHSASATAAHHGLSSGARKGVIAGATVGAIAILLLIIGIFLLLSRKRGRNTSGRTPLAVVEQRQEPDGPYNKGLNALSGTRVWEHGEI